MRGKCNKGEERPPKLAETEMIGGPHGGSDASGGVAWAGVAREGSVGGSCEAEAALGTASHWLPKEWKQGRRRSLRCHRLTGPVIYFRPTRLRFHRCKLSGMPGPVSGIKCGNIDKGGCRIGHLGRRVGE